MLLDVLPRVISTPLGTATPPPPPPPRSREARRAVSSVLKVTKPVEVQINGSPAPRRQGVQRGPWRPSSSRGPVGSVASFCWFEMVCGVFVGSKWLSYEYFRGALPWNIPRNDQKWSCLKNNSITAKNRNEKNTALSCKVLGLCPNSVSIALNNSPWFP